MEVLPILDVVIGMVVGASLVLLSRGKKKYPNDVVEVWQSDPGPLGREWYWHRKSPNHEIISNGEGYQTKQGAVQGAFRANPDIKRVEVKGAEIIRRKEAK